MMYVLVLSLAAAACIFFVVRWVQLRRGYHALSKAEQRRAEVEALREEAAKVTKRQRIRNEIARLGLGDSMFPFYAAAALVYLATAAVMTVVGLPVLVGFAAAVPGAVGVAYLAVSILAHRRRSLFNKQFIDLLDQVVAQIKAGVGAERALGMVVPNLADPIREEMTRAVAAGQAGRDLVESLRQLRTRYPSRAFDMFISALEIDRAEGQAIAPALDQAASLLKQDFALAAEANAELAQIKYEFYAVTAIIIGIGLFLIFGGDPAAHQVYLTGGGIIAILVAAGNIALGTFRFQRMITKLKGDT